MKTIFVIVALTAICLVGFGAAYAMTNAANSPISAASSVIQAGEGLTVSVAGEVNLPGTYVLSPGATMLDLISAAQGTTGNADALSFNTDCVLESKQTYYIAPLFDNSSSCSASPITKTNINADDADVLQNVAGFTKTVANAIVSYRSGAPFRCIEDLKKVSGIGAATYEKVKAKVTLRSA